MSTTDGRSLREHARDAVRDEVVRQAWSLFAVQGYDATTIDQVASASGMSRRTFFRYFEGKDELVLERLVESGSEIAASLAGRPGAEPVWDALRAAFQESVHASTANEHLARPLQRMLREESALRGTITQWRHRWEELLAPLVAARLGRDADDPGAWALAASALACFEVARETWSRRPGADLGALLDEAMGAVTPLRTHHEERSRS